MKTNHSKIYIKNSVHSELLKIKSNIKDVDLSKIAYKMKSKTHIFCLFETIYILMQNISDLVDILFDFSFDWNSANCTCWCPKPGHHIACLD